MSSISYPREAGFFYHYGIGRDRNDPYEATEVPGFHCRSNTVNP